MQTNANEAARHLQEEITKEMEEISHIQLELQTHQEHATKMRTEIPQLQRKVEDDKHELFQDENLITKLKAELAKLQREKLKLQNDLNVMKKTFEDSMRKQALKGNHLN